MHLMVVTVLILCVLHAAWKVVPMGFSPASVIYQQRNEIVMLTTGCKDIDQILEGRSCQARMT